jgi:hypothetical protein
MALDTDLELNTALPDQQVISKEEFDNDTASDKAKTTPAAPPADKVPDGSDLAPPPPPSDSLGGGVKPEESYGADVLDKLFAASDDSKKDDDDKSLTKPAKVVVKPKDDATKSAADDKSKDDATKPAADPYDEIKLAPYAKPETGEQFGKLKTLAREREKAAVDKLTAAQKALEDAQAKVKEQDEKLAAALPLEDAKELQDLRQWRKSLDVERDPSFQVFDQEIVQADDSIYETLRGAGMTAEQVEQIKKLGGPTKVDWVPIFDAIKPSERRAIEAKLIRQELIKDNKLAAITKAKANADEFIATREKEKSKVQQESQQVEDRTLQQITKDADWLKERATDEKADEAAKASAANWNKFVKEQKNRIQSLMRDHSPGTRAELVVGTAMAYHFKASADLLTAELTKITKERDDARAELDRIKKASGASRRPASTQHAPAKSRDMTNLRPADALDALRAELEAR